MADSDVVEEVEKIKKLKKEFLECSICLEEYDEEGRQPRLLPCLHTFCNVCLSKIYKNTQVTCSICKKEHNIANIETVPVDRTRWDLLDFVRAVTSVSSIECEVCDQHIKASHRCQGCSKFFCEECIAAHNRIHRILGNHYVFDLQRKSGHQERISRYAHQQYCENHGDEKLLYYCLGKNCGGPICNSCYVLNHSDKEEHTVKAIADVYDKEKTELLELSRSVQSKIDETTLIAEKVDLTINSLVNNEKQAIEEVDAAFNICAELLERRRQDQRRLIKEKSEVKQKVLREQAESLSSYIDYMRTDCKFLEQSLSSENPAGFLIIAPTIRNKLQSMLNQETENKPFQTDHLEYIKQNVATNFSKFLQTLGSVATSSLFPPNTRINVRDKDPEVNKSHDIDVQLFDHDQNPLVDDNVDILVRITPPEGNVLNTSCEKTAEGQYRTAWTPTAEGQHFVQGFAFNGKLELPGKNIDVVMAQPDTEDEASFEERDCQDVARWESDDSSVPTTPDETSLEERDWRQDVAGRWTIPPPPTTPGEIQYLTMNMDVDTLYKELFLSEDRMTLFNNRHPPPPGLHIVRQLYSHNWPVGGHALHKYMGVKGSKSVSPPDNVYYEVDVHYNIHKDLGSTNLVFEVGLACEKEMDINHFVGGNDNCISLYLATTKDVNSTTLHCWNNKQAIFATETGSSKAGTTTDLRIGISINTGTRTVSFVDVENKKLLTRIRDVDTSQPLWPMFGVYNQYWVDCRITLRSVDSVNIPVDLLL